MTVVTVAIDASTYTGTVAVFREGALVASREAAMRGDHEERLLPALADALRDASAVARDVAAVVCGAGPGSFTPLRIAASIAKGIALANGARFSSVSSLALMAADAPGPGRYLAALDAMRGEMYVSLIEVDAARIVVDVGPPELVPAGLLGVRAAAAEAVLFGPGLASDARPRAAALERIAPHLVTLVPLASWQPQYGRLAEAQVKWEATHGRPLLTR